jgi:uncharacterized LabA/DUF88 family protein
MAAIETARLAVLIDADNATASVVKELLEEVAKYGTATVKRAYGDWTTQNLVGWKEHLHRHAIQPMQQFAYTKGKNSTDSAFIIDAMDLLYAGNVEAFALVSSDSDFTGLALRLRESGKVVYGLGEKKTPQSLQNACDRFIALEVLGEDSTEPAAEPANDPTDDTDDGPRLNLQSVLTKAVNATADDEGWTSVSAIGNHLSRTHASFDPRNFGHAKLSSLVAAQGYLETRVEGAQIRVCLKGNPGKTPARKATAKTATRSTTKKAAKKP